MASSAPTPVLLLKTQSLPKDPYHTLLSSSPKYTPIFLPVLTHSFFPTSLSHLRSLFLDPSTFQSTYTGGIVLTSQRAVECLDTAFSSETNQSISLVKDPWSQLALSHPGSILQFYVVGPATHISVSALVDKHFPPELARIDGQETGAGEALASYIIAHQHDQRADAEKRILFPTGEKHQDSIPRLLSAAGWTVSAEICYGTITRSEFAEEITRELEALRRSGVRTFWIVVFSGQGCEEMLQAINDVNGQTESRSEGLRPRVMSIGPTTERFLAERCGFEVEAVAVRPSAEGMMLTLEEFEKS